MAAPPKKFEFPFVENYDVQDASFFRQGKELPTPDEVRARAAGYQSRGKLLLRPPLLRYRSLGLAVKFGNHVSIAEAHCLMFLRKHAPTVPVPELFGWRRDKRQTFIYMKYVDGFTASRLTELSGVPPFPPIETLVGTIHVQVLAVIETLKRIPQSLVTPVPFVGESRSRWIQCFKGLVSDCSQPGHVNGTHLQDWAIINSATPVSEAGPFPSVAAFHDWSAYKFGRPSSCDLPAEMYEQYRSLLPDDSTVTLAHGGLTPDNLIVSQPVPGGTVTLQAVVDWSQAGWYPSYWDDYKLIYANNDAKDDGVADPQGVVDAYTFFTLNAST